MADKKADKPNILIWGDYCCATGFATVLGNIARQLHKTGKYELDVLAINYSGDPRDNEKWPGNVWPAMPGGLMNAGAYGDVYGRQRLLDLMGSGRYDMVFMLQDTFVLEPIMDEVLKTQETLVKRGMKTFKTVYYFPVDAPLKEQWVKDVVAKVDFPVVYTEYGKAEVLKHDKDLAGRLKVIYHGNNPNDFFPLQDREDVAAFRKNYFNGKAEDRFLIVNVNRNQPRKDIARSLMILKELWNRGRKPLLYLHMQFEDTGGNIFTIAKQLGLGKEFEFFLPGPNIFNANQGMPIEDVNRIYNAADCVLTTTLGEGWGLSVTEAMATKTPIVGPANTSLVEIMANGRGALVPSGNNKSMWVVKEMDNERIRPLMDVEAAADAIEAIMDGKLPNIHAAYQWVRELDWEKIVPQWEAIWDEALAASKTENAKPKKPIPQFANRAQRRQWERQQRKQEAKN